MFRFITLPSIRAALVVVITTIGIGTLKVFDIVRTMTGRPVRHLGRRERVLQCRASASNASGLGAALAVLLFVLVIPIVAYNIVQMRKEA